MRVLSLFDGISTGQLALKHAQIKVDKYFASEIDPYAIKVTQHNFPRTKQLGDVYGLNESNLPEDIDLLLAGFPCQSFSQLSSQLGTETASGLLVHELIRIRDIVKPTYFLFENVYMLPSHLRMLNELFGCDAIGINSSYFSAQARKRLYWTNFNVDVSNLPTNTLCFNDIRDFKDTRDLLKGDNVLPGKEKFYLPFPSGNPVGALKSGLVQLGELRLKADGRGLGGFRRKRPVQESEGINKRSKNKVRIENRVYSDKGKYPCLTSAGLGACVLLDGGQTIRRPNSLEKERLQGLPDNYTSVKGSMSAYRRRVLIGNAWQKDVISAILR